MAYCRFSDGDVYAYESEDGYNVFVAGSRHDPPLTRFDSLDITAPTDDSDSTDYFSALVELIAKRSAEAEMAKLVPINGPYDGDARTFSTPQELLDFLVTLRNAGYDVPEYALDDLKLEILDLEKKGA